MEYEGVNNNANTNTADIAQETKNNLTAPPEKPNSKLSGFLDKLGKSPLFIGGRKFISLPLMVLALTAVIVAPIIIINANKPPLNPLDYPAYIAWVEDYADKLQVVLDDDGVDKALNYIDSLLSTEKNPPRRRILLNDKAILLSRENNFNEAIAALEEYVEYADDVSASREAGIRHLADLHYEKGDLERALELFEQALEIAFETGNHQGNEYYLEMIETIESELNGAEQ
jgi:tetratricopeptide (TPR) repeat protein